jgi:hypothetical protein
VADVASFCLDCPNNGVPLLEASRNRDAARVADKATRFRPSVLQHIGNRDVHRRRRRSGRVRYRCGRYRGDRYRDRSDGYRCGI